MMNKYKLQKEISNVKLLFTYFFHYSFKLGFWTLIDGVAQRLKNDKLNAIAHEKRYEECKQYIRIKCKDIIDKYKKCKETNEKIGNDSFVWIYWGQGFDDLPFPVENTVESIKKHCTNRTIVLLSDENLGEYIELKDFIIKKYKDGKISRAAFSDLIRINILKEYGGIWLDSTYYFTGDLDTKISNYSFYSICHGNKRKWVVSKDIWSISFVAVHANSKLMSFVYDIYDRYWEEENTLIGYLLIDCIMAIAYEEYEDVRKTMDVVPINNLGVFDFLETSVNKICSEKEFRDFMGDTYIHKLTYKMNYETTKDGRLTYIGRLLKE